MTRRRTNDIPDLYADPFAERSTTMARERVALLGCSVDFESNSRRLMQLVRVAYGGLPPHRLSDAVPQLKIRLLATSAGAVHRRSEPPPLEMLAGAGFFGGATHSSSFVIVSPEQHSGLVVVPPSVLRFPYHTRYELIEFALFTLAARVKRLVPLHAACIGREGRGVLLMGDSGAGKSTVALLCLLAGFDFLSEDSVFVEPDSLLATGVANFLHVRANSLRWVEQQREVAAIRRSTVIRRRSGVRKFEVDLRQRRFRLARQPQQIQSLVFLSSAAAGSEPMLRPLSKRQMLARLTAAQAYGAGQPGWAQFCASLSRIESFELRRGRHPSESVEALQQLTQAGSHG